MRLSLRQRKRAPQVLQYLTPKVKASVNRRLFFGLQMDMQREVLLFIVEDFHANPIMDAIYKAGNFKDGRGMAFSWTVDRVIGTESQMEALEKAAQEKYI